MVGATGLVGRAILLGLLGDEKVGAVHALDRRPVPQLQHTKLIRHTVDFKALPDLPRADEMYIALGTTIKVAGSQEAFRTIDYHAVIAVAKAAKKAGVKRLGVVSAIGANAKSGVFYNRVKGDMEDALTALDFDTLVIARPSFLAGDRESLGQPRRSGEAIALGVSRVLAPLIPDNYKSIDPALVARALLDAVPNRVGRHVLMSAGMRRA